MIRARASTPAPSGTRATKLVGKAPSGPATSRRTNTPASNEEEPLMKPAAVLGLVLLLFLPLAGTAQQQETQQQRAQSQPYNNAPVWREVRSGKEEYTSIKGRETGVLIQTYGETWRQLKNAWITPIAGWLIAAVVVVIGAFYKRSEEHTSELQSRE